MRGLAVRLGGALGAAVALGVVALAVPAVAQNPPSPRAPNGLVVPTPGGRSTVGLMEGSLKKIDPAGHTVQISAGPFDSMERTLGLTDQTQIQVDGRRGTLADLQEGSTVRAAYEGRDGRIIATLIEVVPPGSTTAPALPNVLPGTSPPPVSPDPGPTAPAPK